MTFKKRQINLFFSNAGKTLTLEGLRCEAVTMVAGGPNMAAQLQLRVYGMTMAQMNEYSSVGIYSGAVSSTLIVVSAGNVGEPIGQIFSGSLLGSFIDFSAAPDVCFVCSATCGLYEKALAAAANTYKGAAYAEDMIEALAKKIGFKFVNTDNAHAVLQNQVVSGSVVDQIQTIARAASIPACIENQTVTIWSNNGARDSVVVPVGPDNGLVGYPSYWEAGFSIKTEYNPLIVQGRTVKLTSSIPKSNGSWIVIYTMHELSTMAPNGPWFTTAKLAALGSNQVAIN